MTLCWETAYKWASLSKQIAALCLNRNSTVAGVIITVTFCIIGVCAPWIWGRMMATLMNQWANEAPIVLVYWNTLREIEDFCSISVECSPVILPEIQTIFPETAIGICFSRKTAHVRGKRDAREMKRAKRRGKKQKGHGIVACHSSTSHKASQRPLSPVCGEDGSRGQISWLGNLLGATCRAADYPWASIIFCLSKMLIVCFYE